MRLRGITNNHEVLILIDSGSSGTFASDKLVRELKLKTFRVPQSQVSVADGSKMLSDSTVQDLTWVGQGHEFQSDARVLSLGCYDIILGMDWLESQSNVGGLEEKEHEVFIQRFKSGADWSKRLYLQMSIIEGLQAARNAEKKSGGSAGGAHTCIITGQATT